MPRVTTNPQAKLTAGQWPQDTLNPPLQSGMPNIAKSNLRLKREAFVMSGKLLQVNYGIYHLTLTVPAYGDFWCKSVGAFCPTPVTTLPDALLLQPYAQVQITDGRTNYKFFQPYIWFSMLVGDGPAFTVSGLTVFPDPMNSTYNPQATSDLPKAHCFTRNSTIQISVNRPVIAGLANPDNVDMYFRFGGWLEYANASG